MENENNLSGNKNFIEVIKSRHVVYLFPCVVNVMRVALCIINDIQTFNISTRVSYKSYEQFFKRHLSFGQ